ncbi:MAG: PadR family transcriptional regulator [Acidobacteria bacterium]|jgi:transcriptional regulator|nr:PadR family transcriptional regulator [Acidobacteriota bacterium]MDP7337989.1 PadR family transcriptional regulator [Vicinamibacterales bacterium]MDP7480221.1 PadR family transcriptional regulator [Vicinamibacterales bacterium]MDP7690349.1 PadR family transcriptional regulator [Vicinamibacterales bacterium]HJN46133.1 PadR family transcriptional regulator [Vicinamibacterales bacterium]|tara:strand:+ start:299 stop:616 length:318 start_codon:yes stop_codon:yes gene_type:complete
MATEKLDLLILKTLDLGPLHGYGISRRIEQVSEGVFRVTLGALYPALQRLERAGAINAEWSVSENNRRARFYTITRTGRRRLTAEEQEWHRVADAMTRILQVEAE